MAVRDSIETLDLVLSREHRFEAKVSVTRGDWYVVADWDHHPPGTAIPLATHLVVVVHPDDEAKLRELLMLQRLLTRGVR